MNVDEIKEWIAVFGLGGVAGTLATLVVKAILERKSEDYKHSWQEKREAKGKRVETDRATYSQRLTILVRENLAAYIRSGRWFTDEDDLKRLVLSLSRGAHEHFLDPEVNRAWLALVSKSVELAARRLTTGIQELEIREYNRIRNEWEDAAKRSFGPLPATPSLTPRREPSEGDPHTELTG